MFQVSLGDEDSPPSLGVIFYTPQVDGVKFGMHRQGPLMDHKERILPTSPADGWRMVVMCAHRYIQ